MAAQNPAELVESIADALAGIADRVGSSASLATNSASVNSSSNLFQSRFDSAHWSGQLLSFTINIDGTVEPTPNWEAGSVLDGQNYNSQRTIMTFSPGVKLVPGSALKGKGIAFKWPSDYTRPNPLTDLTPRQITLLLTNASFPPSTSERAET